MKIKKSCQSCKYYCFYMGSHLEPTEEACMKKDFDFAEPGTREASYEEIAKDCNEYQIKKEQWK